MAPQIPVHRFRRPAIDCLYNAARLNETEVGNLLADGAAKLFAGKEPVGKTRHAEGSRVSVAGRSCFAKEYTLTKWYKRLWDQFVPNCQRNFSAGMRLLQAELPTATPLLAAALAGKGPRRQILVTDFCENTADLDEYIKKHSQSDRRRRIFAELAFLLSEFHCKGFYSQHLRAANILVAEENGSRSFCFIDLDRLGPNWFMPNAAFIGTVSRACFEFYEFLSPEEQQYLLRTCFDMALKQKIYRKHSQEQWFVNAVAFQIKKRKR